jgi:1,4-dihydroxy-6-naphthoate synthase
MVHGRIDLEGLEFDYFLSDVEDLNLKSFAGEVDVTKISFHAFAYAAEKYLILDSGSALGYHNGPLLISKYRIKEKELSSKKIAIPGKYTTANLLLSIAFPEAINKTEYLFSDIEQALLDEKADAGLIIHETRFTYHKKGLLKIADMGEFWENLTGHPIPLGTIVVRRDLPEEVQLKVNRIVRRSIDYAYRDASASYKFVASNAKEMDSSVMNKHIKLFVNEFSQNLGIKGKNAINELFSLAQDRKVIPQLPERIFLT